MVGEELSGRFFIFADEMKDGAIFMVLFVSFELKFVVACAETRFVAMH